MFQSTLRKHFQKDLLFLPHLTSDQYKLNHNTQQDILVMPPVVIKLWLGRR